MAGYKQEAKGPKGIAAVALAGKPPFTAGLTLNNERLARAA